MQLPDDWQQCHDFFLQQIYERSGSLESLATYRSILIRFFRDLTKSPDAYTHTDILAFIQQRSTSRRNFGQPVSASTHNQRLCVLRSFYAFASAFEIDGTPLFQKQLPTTGIRYLKRPFEPRYLTASEINRVFQEMPSTIKGVRDRALFLTYFLTARRRREIYALRVGDIEPAILVDPDGTRRPGYIYHFIQKGSQRTRRSAELPALAYEAIIYYWRMSGRIDTLAPSDPVFTSVKPGTGHKGSIKGSISNLPLHPDYINWTLKQYIAAAGLDASKYSMHVLRHSSARERYALGEGVVEIQQLLGHSNLGTTQKYLMLLSGISDKGARLLEERFGHLAAPD